MSGLLNSIQDGLAARLVRVFIVTTISLFLAGAAQAGVKFDRTYNTQGHAHLTISNINGSIVVNSWNRKTVSVSANNESSTQIEEQVAGDDIRLSVKRSLQMGKADFQIFVPADTALTLNNYIGRIEVRGLRGHLSIKSYDSEVRLIDVHVPSADVNVTTGDIFFDGDLSGDGPFTLQTLKGDVDVSLPESTSFQLSTRALSENINLGSFLNSLSGGIRAPKSISGTHLKGGPRLNLITFAGRILLHKK